jgi:hypothetical protein
MKEKIAQIIKGLINKTKKDQAVWKRTSRRDEFMLRFSHGTATIDLWIETVGTNITNVSDFRLYDNDGYAIYSITCSKLELPNEYLLLKELHSAAKESFYKEDETINSILQEINSNKTLIGKTY